MTFLKLNIHTSEEAYRQIISSKYLLFTEHVRMFPIKIDAFASGVQYRLFEKKRCTNVPRFISLYIITWKWATN